MRAVLETKVWPLAKVPRRAKATDNSERGFSSQPIDLDARWRRGQHWTEVSSLEGPRGNSSGKDEGVERFVMRLSKSAAFEAK